MISKYAADAEFRVLQQMPEFIEKQAARIDALEQELETLQREKAAAKLAALAHDKGLHREVEVDQLTDYLNKMAEADPVKYAGFQQLVENFGPNMGDLVQVADKGSTQGNTWDTFEDFVLHG